MNEMLFQILLSLKDAPQDAEGILGRIRELEKRTPAIASFYRGLNKAADAGYLQILEAEEPEGRGRPRQRYRITRAGRSSLEAEARRLGRLAKLALSAGSESR